MHCYTYDEWPRIVGMLENGWYQIVLSKRAYIADNHRFVTYTPGERCFYFHKKGDAFSYRVLNLDQMSRTRPKHLRPKKEFRGTIFLGFRDTHLLELLLFERLVNQKA